MTCIEFIVCGGHTQRCNGRELNKGFIYKGVGQIKGCDKVLPGLARVGNHSSWSEGNSRGTRALGEGCLTAAQGGAESQQVSNTHFLLSTVQPMDQTQLETRGTGNPGMMQWKRFQLMEHRED